jgi:hypothetical protein
MAPDQEKPDAPQAAGAYPQVTMVKFPEDQIKGDGFTQFDPATGWFWIGLRPEKFSFRTAWAYVKSQEFGLAQLFDQIEANRMLRAQIGAKGAQGRGVGKIIADLTKGIRR